MKLKNTLLLALFALFGLVGCCDDLEPKASVSVLFPADKSSSRWQFEADLLVYSLVEKGYLVTIERTDNPAQAVGFINRMGSGNSIALVFVSPDTQSEAINGALTELKAKGCQVVCYDRLQQNTAAVDYLIAASNEKIGALQAGALKDLPAGSRIEFVGGAKSDENARELYDAWWSGVSERVGSGHFVVPSGRTGFDQVALADWSIAAAKTYFADLLSTHYSDGSLPDGVLAGNDRLALGVVQAMEARGEVRRYPILTGQDNTRSSAVLILQDKQTMTVDKNLVGFVSQTVDLVERLYEGQEVSLTKHKSNGSKEVPMVEISVSAVTR